MSKPALSAPISIFLPKSKKYLKGFLTFFGVSFFLLLNPSVALADCTPTGLGVCINNDPASLVNQILQIAIGVAGGIAFLMLVYGAFRMIFSQGNPESIQDAREIITGAIIGLLLVVFSVFLLRLIGINILGLPI